MTRDPDRLVLFTDAVVPGVTFYALFLLFLTPLVSRLIQRSRR